MTSGRTFAPLLLVRKQLRYSSHAVELLLFYFIIFFLAQEDSGKRGFQSLGLTKKPSKRV